MTATGADRHAPERRILATLDGATFCPDEEVWHLSALTRNLRVDFSVLRGRLDEAVIRAARYVAEVEAPNVSSETLASHIRSLGMVLRMTECQSLRQIDDIFVANAFARSKADTALRSYLAEAKPFLLRWRACGAPGVTMEAVRALRRLRLSKQVLALPVQSADPHAGPLTDLEFKSLTEALHDAFSDGTIELEDYVLCLLTLAFGSRPIQFAAMKVRDLSVVDSGRGDRAYLLSIPRAKQKGATAANRVEFKVRPLVGDIGRLVEALVEQRKTQWAHVPVAEEDIPMFGAPGAGSTAPGLEMHPTSARLASRISDILSRLPVASERTGVGLRTSSRRLRYTKGSRMAAEGHRPAVIAEMLDHTNTRTATVYVAAVPAILERIDRAMAMSLAPMAQAFQGELLEPGVEANRSRDVESHLRRSPDEAPVGNCGSYGFCAAAAPIACYTCRHFQPWLDGPHEEMLAQLLSDRERTILETGDLTIAAINDRTILSCAQVVRMCVERKALHDA